MRNAIYNRVTKETKIECELNLDGAGTSCISTPIPMFSHMLEAFASQGIFDLSIKINGDIDKDQHHTIEDTGIVLGNAFALALGEKRGINRTSFILFPMDESLVTLALDLSGRYFFEIQGNFTRRYCGGLDLDLIEDFFIGFCSSLKMTLHVEILKGRNDHHKLEAIFKGFGKILADACSINPRIKNIIPSTKGVL